MVAQCVGCGTTEPPLHELSNGIFACDVCIDATLAVLARMAQASQSERR
jgi:hypothetical protein